MTRPNAMVMVTVIAFFFAGLASWGVYSYLRKESKKVDVVEGSTVVTAASDILLGTKLDQKNLKTVNWPKGTVPGGGFANANSVIGRVAVTHISAGDVVTEQKLMPQVSSGSGVMTHIVPPGHRAVTVSVNEAACIAGFLAPNNRVDVVLTTPLPGSSTSESISKIVLQNVAVLATGQATEQKEGGKPNVVTTVTLDLTPEDSEKLIFATHKGTLQLLLRNIADSAKIETPGATINQVVSGLERPSPKARPKNVKAPSPPPPYSPPTIAVEIIKGKERTSKQFTEVATARK